ncbi:ABC transporter permease [Chitinophaga vietnamensis]|uniref:ABC transporter permease n=1 Tax=Chitinophaga vietnamensis TaxID=2593957 RepID=UPI001177637F|nr:ABC transporter permease [Chitinophaga vietnamensis]
MLKNYLKIAWRNLKANKIYSLINISGLCIGMAVALLAGRWIFDEYTFDRQHEHYSSIARVMQHQVINGEKNTYKAVPAVLGEELRNSYGGNFQQVVLSSWTNPHLLSFKDKHLSLTGNFMQPGAPEMLTLHMAAGTREGLRSPAGLLLSASAAQALFGDAHAIGSTIQLDTATLTVTGIYEDLPYNSSFANLKFIAPWDLYAATPEVKESKDDWNANSYQLFVQLAPAADFNKVAAAIKDVKRSKLPADQAALQPEIFLHPMSRWHLYEEFKNGVNTGGNITFVRLFGIIGLFVLLLACINFMNLSTARSGKRAREIGVRKVVGSRRSQLVTQFFIESAMMVAIAFVVALLITKQLLPLLNSLTAKEMTMGWGSPLFWVGSIGFCFIVSLVAGAYPAFYLSALRPVKALKGTFRAQYAALFSRRALVVLQFTVSVVLIIGTIVAYRQVRFARERPVGYTRAGLVVARPYNTDIHDHIDAVKQDLLQSGAVTAIAESGNTITRGSRSSGGFDWTGKAPGAMDDFTTVSISHDYGKATGWQVAAGRDFSPAFTTDSSAIVLNEAAVKYMGLKNPVGEIVRWNGRAYHVIGVIRNIIMESPYAPVKQAVYFLYNGPGVLNIRINPARSAPDALAAIEAIYHKYAPDQPFDYRFVDEEYARKFGIEEYIARLAAILAVLAIFISCLGLYGIAAFMAEQRTREIGIRKVMGATVANIWRLLSGEFLLLATIAFAVAAPLAWYAMSRWLEHYTYHTAMTWWIFAAAGGGAMLLTLLTVSFQTMKAALMNPARSLKRE